MKKTKPILVEESYFNCFHLHNFNKGYGDGKIEVDSFKYDHNGMHNMKFLFC